MSIKSPKQKGNKWERDAGKLLQEAIHNSTWKRIPGSGAIGTIVQETLLTGDLTGTVELYPKKFKGEAKIGYGGKTQLTLKKEWLDKIAEEAGNNYSIPFLVGRFSGSRSGVQEFIVLDIDTFASLINVYTDLQRTLLKNNEEEKSQ
jgi:hypothetical protein